MVSRKIQFTHNYTFNRSRAKRGESVEIARRPIRERCDGQIGIYFVHRTCAWGWRKITHALGLHALAQGTHGTEARGGRLVRGSLRGYPAKPSWGVRREGG